MGNNTSMTFKYTLFIEAFFIFICALLAVIEHFLGAGNLTIKGVLYCLVVFQVPVIVLVCKYWRRLSNDPYIN